MRHWIILKFAILLHLYGVDADFYDCQGALGMQSGTIRDDWIHASSSYDEASVGPKNGRLKTERNGGAWCPQNQISRTVHEWLEIDLQTLHRITSVETQGRFGNGQGQEYAEQYTLEYQREETSEWMHYEDKHEEDIFPGNVNTYLTVQNRLDPAIIARKIRIVPYSSHPRTVCMRVEVYGCKWKHGVMSYKVPQGERRGAELDLFDFTYDGKTENGILLNGLGQLIDGEEGQSNFRLDPGETGKKGYEWIGWKNESINTPPIELLFEFDSVRNFTEVRIHANNMFTKDVRVFKTAKIYFSVGGKYYQSEPVLFDYMRDTLIEFARQVIIPIKHRIARFVKIHLYFDSKWLMISEVRFESELAKNNFSIEVPPAKENTPRAGIPDVSKEDSNIIDNENDNNTHPSEEQPHNEKLIGIIIGALAAMIIVLLTIVAFCIVRARRQKYENKKVNTLDTPIAYDLNDLRALSNGKVSHGNMYNPVTQDELLDHEHHMMLSNGNTLQNGTIYSNTFNNGIQTRQLPDLPAKIIPSDSDTVTSTYAVPDMSNSTFTPKVPPKPTIFTPNILMHDGGSDSSPPPPPPPHPRALYGGSDALTLQLQGFSGASHYAVTGNFELLWKEDLSVHEFPRQNLQFVEKLGEGQFGEVHLCEASNLVEFLGDDFLVNRTGSQTMRVAVKLLRPNAGDMARNDFHKEVKVMSKLKDPNIVLLLGVCTQEEPLCMIVEYMKFGDLNQFLRQHVPLESTIAKNPNVKCLSYGCLIYMATQIASGMKYLETLNMVHRDLATRNCLVGANYTIKISDFGMSRGLYSSDYYRIEGKAMLPIRWMSWESVLLGKFSTKSDVWSFAVTIWEILTMARETPFDHLTDEQVIDNCSAYYRNSFEEIVTLPQPQNCPKEIFDLVSECWNRDDGMRPTFREIHMFLQRKNMGYNPRDERGTPSKFNIPVV